MYNQTGDNLRICLASDARRCMDLPAGSSPIVIGWGKGIFVVEAPGCSRTYDLPLPENLDNFREGYNDPIGVLIANDYTIQLLKRTVQPTENTLADQPPGYPVSPSENGMSCS